MASGGSRPPPLRHGRWRRRLGIGLATLALALGAAGSLLVARLRASLPLQDGERPLAGLAAAVRIERDALGVPVVRGDSRLDVARATGFLHAQERFFQMDLLRRRAAGELAELAGRAALASDREVRPLRLRAVARRALGRLPADERALLDAYSEGVGAGLSALAAPPFEYLLLRATPAPWRPEDSLLCSLTMSLTLQAELPAEESTLGVMHDTLPGPVFEFLAPEGTEWDAPLEGKPLPQPAIPGPDVVDLRAGGARPGPDEPLARGVARDADAVVFGSNNWALAGSHTADGSSLVANDMHLGLDVPNVWYRASLVTAGARVTGVTLPGAPFVIAGSNGRIAWGFTNAEGDWADLVVLEPVGRDPDAYRTPQGTRRLEHVHEVVHVAGAEDLQLDTLQTIWGPVLDVDHAGRRRALAWVALRDGGLDAGLVRLERAASVAEALAIAPTLGMPEQNLVVGDVHGRIGWTIAGRIPRRFGFDGRLPTSWADGTRGWHGWLPAQDCPRVVDPPDGRLFTANARVVGGEALRRVGFGSYDLGARQRQIRDDLRALPRTASEADMLRIQLDDRARFLGRWQRLLLAVLTPASTAADPRRAEARRLVAAWGGRASVASVGYRIVRAFRNRVADEALTPLLAPCRAADQHFDYLGRTDHKRAYRQWEGPLWVLVSKRPPHLLSPRYRSWEALLTAALDGVLAELAEDGPVAERSWGERNTSLVRHPLSRAVPGLARLLDMPRLRLPGDGNMPRFQSPSAGASERFAVSPGHEDRGYFQMPGGESGNPLSPHYGDGHQAWAEGRPTPFLPGPAEHVLTLVPEGPSHAGKGASPSGGLAGDPGAVP